MENGTMNPQTNETPVKTQSLEPCCPPEAARRCCAPDDKDACCGPETKGERRGCSC